MMLFLSFFGLVLSSCGDSNTATQTDATNSTPGTCPNGYISIPANVTLGVSNFCVMQFEAKYIAGAAISQSASTPWVSITQTAAKTACASLGAGHDLISNAEWMTIAQDAENVASNWSSGNIGTGVIPIGHSDNVPANALAVINTADSYDGTGNTSAEALGSFGWAQKRTLTLSNGNIIWDFSGNVHEWVDWSIADGLQLGPTTCQATIQELPSVSCGALAAADYLPSHSTYNSSQGMGKFYGSNGGAATRGGSWENGWIAGIFALFLDSPSTNTRQLIGFRCVYRP